MTQPVNFYADGLEKEDLVLLLNKLALYGKPRLGVFDKGWHCVIDLFATGKGVEFKVASEFGHQSPLSATLECIERLIEVLDGIKKLT